MKLQLPNSVSSQQDLTALTLEVHNFAAWSSSSTIKNRVSAKSPASEPPVLSPAAKELLGAWGNDKLLSTESLNELSEALKEYAESAPTMTITLAAPPTGDIKQMLVDWCRKNIDPAMLVAFEFNGNLLGGIVVRKGSHIFDWSFRRQILDQRAKFPEALRNVR
jgi:hypothetical protein